MSGHDLMVDTMFIAVYCYQASSSSHSTSTCTSKCIALLISWRPHSGKVIWVDVLSDVMRYLYRHISSRNIQRSVFLYGDQLVWYVGWVCGCVCVGVFLCLYVCVCVCVNWRWQVVIHFCLTLLNAQTRTHTHTLTHAPVHTYTPTHAHIHDMHTHAYVGVVWSKRTSRSSTSICCRGSSPLILGAPTTSQPPSPLTHNCPHPHTQEGQLECPTQGGGYKSQLPVLKLVPINTRVWHPVKLIPTRNKCMSLWMQS